MDKKIVLGIPLLIIGLLATLFIPLFSQNSRNPEEDIWARNSVCLDAFLADPMAFLPILERMDDLYYWTLIYGEINGFNFVKEVFSKKFRANDVDEAQLNSILRLLKVYSSPLSYGLIRPIISRIIEIASNRSEWFARNLLSKDDWKEILRLIVRGDIENASGLRGGLKEILSNIEDSQDKKRLMESFVEIENEKREDAKKLSEFMKDPLKDLDGIEGIYSLCAVTGPIYLDNSLEILISWLRNEPDGRKLAIMFHFMSHCDSAYHREMLDDVVAGHFLKHTTLFVSALEKTPNWRWIVYIISGLLNEEDKESIIGTIGNTGFQIKVKSQLEFLRDHIRSRL